MINLLFKKYLNFFLGGWEGVKLTNFGSKINKNEKDTRSSFYKLYFI